MNLSIDNLCVQRGDRQVINDLSFQVGSGEALLVKGVNGCGKTTLLRTLAGFIPPHAGRVGLEGAGAEDRIRDHCHYVGHLNAIKSSQTVAENIAFYAGFLNADMTKAQVGERVSIALQSFGLDGLAAVPSGYLSACQKRRLALARILCVPRKIWLLDEPTTSLDQISTAQLSAVLDHHVANGGIVIAATHVDLTLKSARSLCLDREARPT